MIGYLVKELIDWLSQVGRFRSKGFKMKVDPILITYRFIPTYNKKLLIERRRK